ncbi:MAG: glycosyltransferase [Dehalococcoidales bacterium]|nr:glycosyltransferase [Dehalococcoidales bacterium]
MTVRPMKLALLCAHSCPVGNLGAKDTGGMNVYVRELASHLGRQGHLVDVYTRVHDPNDDQVVEIGDNARLIHLRAGDFEDIHKLMVYTYLPDFVCNLENFRREHNLCYDLVFSHYWLSGWAGKLLQCWWNVPHMTMFHTLGAVKNALGIGEDEPELRIEAERNLIGDSQRIIIATERDKAQLIANYLANPDRISVIPCGVNLDRFQPTDAGEARRYLGLSEEDKVVLFVGRIEPLKGIDKLIQAVGLLRGTPNLKLIIIGGDACSRDDVDQLKGLCRSLGIEDSVSFQELVKQERLPCYYSAADVTVMPSYYESFGLVALESLACGTPVVTTRVGDMENIVIDGKTGYVVANNTPKLLADRISRLLARPHVSNGDKALMVESVARFDWANIAAMIAEECDHVLADRLVGSV